MKYSVSDLSDLIKDRRTIQPKDYSDRVVHRDIIERVLQNATWAPTHGMTQPWRFSVFTGSGLKALSGFLGAEYTRITPPDRFMPRKYENHVQRPLQTTVAVALGMARDPNGKISELEEMLATACAVQNMHLTSTAYGLGAFWSTGAAITGDGMRDFLGLGAQDRCLGIFYMGYPAADWPKGYRRSWVDVTTWRTEG